LRRGIVEDVSEGAADYAKCFFVAVDGERGLLADVERTDVVETENVVGVAVGEEDGVEAVEVDAESLLAEIGGGIDYYVLSVAGKQERRAQAIVVGIFRGADAAVAG
jgi:hypothetical protein